MTDSTDLATLARRVRRLEDEAAIRDVLAAYAFAADMSDAEGWLSLFAENAYFTAPGLGRSEGRQAIRTLIDRLLAHNANVANQHDPLGPLAIEIDGDAARADGYSLVLSVAPGSAPEIDSVNLSRWTFVRQGDRWLISGRDVRSLDAAGLQSFAAEGFGFRRLAGSSPA
ncbi:MAG TPA: nuclear transport factor 2 family protein [Acidimicrobiales bacterium]|jgi:uncharacterized protein (TIGR02246 family)|nr:nuclear transport factor 2 family protein [Acidimicrobiales bacterium]